VLRDRRAEMEAAMRTEEEELARLSEEARSKVYIILHTSIKHTYTLTYACVSVCTHFSSVYYVLYKYCHTSLLNESAAIAHARRALLLRISKNQK
jgi:hypothetical protein